MILLLALLSFVSSFIFLYFVKRYLENGRLSSGDTFFHLSISKSIKTHHWKYPSSLQNVRFIENDNRNNYLNYPPLLHYITAIFPLKYHINVAKNLNLFIVSLIGIIAAISAFNFSLSLYVGLLAGFIVVFNLSVFEIITGFTPRPLGLLFYSLMLYIALFFPQTLVSILVISLLVMLITLSHKFAVQVLIIGLLPYSLLFNKPYFVVSFVLGFALSIVVSRGFYLKILKEHVNWLHFYSHHRPSADFIKKWSGIFARNSWWVVITLSIILLVIQQSTNWYSNIIGRALFWAFAPLLTAFFVSIPQLAFMGEDYRYVEYSLVPVGALVGYFALTTQVGFLILLPTIVCISISILTLIKYKGSLADSKFLVDKDVILTYGSLKEYVSGYLLVFPQWRTLEVSYFTNLPIIHNVRKGNQSDSEILKDLINVHDAQYFLKFKGIDPYHYFATLVSVVSVIKIFESPKFELYKLASKDNSVVA